MRLIKFSLGIFLVSLTTITMELVLARVFDVVLVPNISYMIITCAMFSFGLSGVYATLNPPVERNGFSDYLVKLSLLLSLSILLIRPVTNLLPFNYMFILRSPLKQIFSFLGLYLVIVTPFFLSGLIIITLFTRVAKKIHNLYFWNLSGGAIGCAALIPLFPVIGPGGLLICFVGLNIFAAALFCENKRFAKILFFTGLMAIVTPFINPPNIYDFVEHVDKRGVKEARKEGRIEFSRWDPISKIDVINNIYIDRETGKILPFPRVKTIAYDGGQWSSFFYYFDGDLVKLRKNFFKDIKLNFWNEGALASHYLKRDTNQRVLIVGSGGGQEIKAALMFGAADIDAIEMVGTVVELGKTRYAGFTGNIFSHPNVHVRVGEGRSFLRSVKDRYDIIQIFSAENASSLVNGSGAIDTAYLQTVEAYKEYFSHLKPDGILHINYRIYPRMVNTAALAWKEMGFSDFQKHVVVFEHDTDILLPTFLVKMNPWKEEEIEELDRLFSMVSPPGHKKTFKLVEDPIHPEKSFLSADFYSGNFPYSLTREMDFLITPTTDHQPYFNFLRKKIAVLTPSPSKFLNQSTAYLLNSQMIREKFPIDFIHFLITSLVAFLFTPIVILVPLFFSSARKIKQPIRKEFLLYFACIGSGFIIFELVFIQVFLKLIGSPLYCYSAVIFSLLFSAGVGSYSYLKLKIDHKYRYRIPFLGILITGVLLVTTKYYLFNYFLASPLPVRLLVSFLMMFPLGFFLGMPFPLSISAIRSQPRGTIAWAWGINSLFTSIGGFSSIILSIFFGFRFTLCVAVFIYCAAFLLFSKIRLGAHR